MKLPARNRPITAQWLPGALAAAAGASAANAAKVQITLANNFAANTANGGSSNFSGDVTGDGNPELSFNEWGMSQNRLSMTIDGYLVKAKVDSSGSFIVRMGAAPPKIGTQPQYARNLIKMGFTDARVNSGARTTGWIDVSASASSAGPRVTIHRLIFDDASTSQPTILDKTAEYPEWVPIPRLSLSSSAVTASSAVIGGGVINAAGKTLTERGVVYVASATNADPKIGGTGVIQRVENPGGTLGDYSFELAGLSSNTAYSFRAYAIDSGGVGYYSDLGTFSTNLAPLITSQGGAPSAVLPIVENNTAVTTVLASDGDSPAQLLSYRIAGGADAAKFRIDAASGVLEFVTAPDFETPADLDANNRYEITVEVSDNGNFPKSVSQALTINVTNFAELALVASSTVTGVAITGATLGGSVVNDGGGGGISERGFVYALTSQNGDPQLGGSGVAKLTVVGTTGSFSRGLSGLTASSGYTFRAYATNAVGTVYSSAANFTTLGTNSAPVIFYDIPALLRPSVAVSYAPVQIGSAVPDGPYLQVTNFAGSGTAGETDGTGTSATFKRPTGATVDAAGNIYVADNGNHKIRKITPQGVVTTLAGDGYEAFFVGRLKNANGTAASFNYPTDLAVDPAAQFLYVADKLNDVIRRVSLTSPYAVTTFAGSGTGGILDSATGSTARFSDPEGIAVDPTGTYLYVADRKNHRIRQITIATAAVTTLAGSGSAGTADHANPLSATFDEPTGIAVDAAGHVYVTDFGGNKLRKIAMTAGVAGGVTSLGGSATFSGPYGVDVDGAGNVYVTEQTSHLVRMISPTGSVSTLAGVSDTAGSSEGIGLAATFNQPSGITIHPNGVAYITHYENAATGNKIRKINLAGYRLTGNLPAGLSFNAATGAISGTPIGLQAASAFSVSVFNYAGSGSTALSVAVGLEPVFPAADTIVLEVGSFAATGVLGALQLGFVPGPKQLLTLVNNTGSSLVSGTFTGLPEGTLLTTTVAGDTFYFKLSYKGGTGNDITLTRSAGPGQVDAPFESGAFPPYLAIRTASALATDSATVSATFKPNGLMTTVHVEYGLTTDYGSSVPVTPANPSNTTEQVVSAVLGGLAQGSNYFYRFTATNVDGTTVTSGRNFFTHSMPAFLAMPSSAQVTTTSAKLDADVSGVGTTTVESYLTGRGMVYAKAAINNDPRIGGVGATAVEVMTVYGTRPVQVGDLTPNTEYRFRAYATNSLGVVYSEVGTFTTEGAASTPAAIPVFAGYAVTAKTGKTLAISPAKLLARATDPDGGAVTLTQVFGPSARGGTLSLTGTLNYTSAASFTGPDSFDVELTGSRGGTLRATINVTVTGDAPASRNLSELKLRDGMVDLTFRGIPGRAYIIQRSSNLTTWTDIATVTAAADGRIDFTDPSPPQPSGYYRTRY